METDRRYMNFRQLAEYLGSTPGSLKAKYKSDGIPHIRYGRRVLFDRGPEPARAGGTHSSGGCALRAGTGRVRVRQEIQYQPGVTIVTPGVRLPDRQ